MSSNCRETMTARAPFTRSAFPSSEDWEIGQVSPGRLTTRGMSHAIKVTPPPRAHCTNSAWRSFACSVAAQFKAERSLRLAGAAAALRQNIGAPLTPAEQAKLEAFLDPARLALANTAGATAWLEGWALPVEKVIEDVLLPEAASPSC